MFYFSIKSLVKNRMKSMHSNHYTVMFVIMVLAGYLSTMNIWADKLEDIRFSLNDLYMVLLMTGWMFFFMGLWYKELYVAFFGIGLSSLALFCIRTQWMITPRQYLQGMIPHHSMAVHMSKKLLEKGGIDEKDFVKGIIETQEKEIAYMKDLLA